MKTPTTNPRTLNGRILPVILLAMASLAWNAPVAWGWGGWGTGPVFTTPYSDFPNRIGADALHEQGITGHGVTIAVIDTGYAWSSVLAENASGDYRLLAQYDAIEDREVSHSYTDYNGHSAHVVSIATGSGIGGTESKYNGVAPDADLVVVKAFDSGGVATYGDVIRGIDWVVANRDAYGIRVLNLSFSGPVRSHYWEDPLAQSVMAAWQAGIVVVTSAGNNGPDAMTVGVPGNVPYVITVGAMTDNFTPGDDGDDLLASFSAAGPTYEAFLKPEVVAPGGHMLGIMPYFSTIAFEHPEFREHGEYFTMSGTSQAAAVVSGITALLLQADPSLTPDGVKCRLIASARPAVDNDGGLAYSVFQQGAGLADAAGAAFSTATGCANGGLDIAKDLGDVEHYFGPAREAEDGSFYVEGTEGLAWDGRYVSGSGYLWSTGNLWNDGYLWSTGNLWNDGYLWSTGNLWNDGYLWSTTDDFSSSGYLWSTTLNETLAINAWVPPE